MDEPPWRTGDDEWTVAGEPESSAWWYPANDHPSDPALLDVSVRVPKGYQAISVGRLASKDTAQEADFDTWHWVMSEPMPTYASFLAIGHYELREGKADGRPYVYAASTRFSDDDERSCSRPWSAPRPWSARSRRSRVRTRTARSVASCRPRTSGSPGWRRPPGRSTSPPP